MTKITSVCNLNVMKEDAGMSDHLDIDGTIELKEGISKEKAIETIEETGSPFDAIAGITGKTITLRASGEFSSIYGSLLVRGLALIGSGTVIIRLRDYDDNGTLYIIKNGDVTRYYGRAVTHFERFPYQFVKDVKKHLSVTDAETIIKILQNDIADGTIQQPRREPALMPALPDRVRGMPGTDPPAGGRII